MGLSVSNERPIPPPGFYTLTLDEWLGQGGLKSVAYNRYVQPERALLYDLEPRITGCSKFKIKEKQISFGYRLDYPYLTYQYS